MEVWNSSEKVQSQNENSYTMSNDYIDDSFDFSFSNVCERPIDNYAKYDDDKEKTQNSTYLVKLQENDESSGNSHE
jgi:hypothetical protein